MKDSIRQELMRLSLNQEDGLYLVTSGSRILKKTLSWDEAREFFGKEVKRIKNKEIHAT